MVLGRIIVKFPQWNNTTFDGIISRGKKYKYYYKEGKIL